MRILVLGGTRYAGVHLVDELLRGGHDVIIATRGVTPDNFGAAVGRKKIERQNADCLRAAFRGEAYDAVIDNLAFSSNEIRYLLDAVQTKKYILTSTVSVYDAFHMDMQETEVDTKRTPLTWCERDDYHYGEVKRQAEAALFQAYAHVPSVAVRFPWIFGTDDYTKRLFFYVEHVFNRWPMHIDNLDSRLSFISSHEAGHFLAWCAQAPMTGYVNACSSGTVSPAEIIAYTERRAGRQAVLRSDGTAAPLNGVPSFCLDTSVASKAGYQPQEIAAWLYPAIDAWLDALCAQQ